MKVTIKEGSERQTAQSVPVGTIFKYEEGPAVFVKINYQDMKRLEDGQTCRVMAHPVIVAKEIEVGF
jgi:hypothetical protein